MTCLQAGWHERLMLSGLTDEYRMIINKAFAAFKVQWRDAPWTERKLQQNMMVLVSLCSLHCVVVLIWKEGNLFKLVLGNRMKIHTAGEIPDSSFFSFRL